MKEFYIKDEELFGKALEESSIGPRSSTLTLKNTSPITNN
jgi:hypothetical protein